MEAMLNFVPAPVAIVLMLAGFIALAVGGIRLGYKATVRVADVITQSQSDSTTRTVRLGTPVWRKLRR